MAVPTRYPNNGQADNRQAFENTSTNVAAAQMRNSLTNLAETVKDPKEKKVRGS